MVASSAVWPVQEAKAKFTELLNTCLAEGPQVVTRRGAAEAVLVSLDEWRKLSQNAKPTLKQLLTADGPRFELDLPERGKLSRRTPQVW
ncbi:MAG: type II toxin-antitoxin system Phd/YefM family antitoxin [Propionibacteriaceae bacterium]|nr:type II toxin-antitoxin system Phd/YefM family antitoxin [Propionibacteriaceae bacterium]